MEKDCFLGTPYFGASHPRQTGKINGSPQEGFFNISTRARSGMKSMLVVARLGKVRPPCARRPRDAGTVRLTKFGFKFSSPGAIIKIMTKQC
jgi:hypothetical protein